MQTVPLPPFAVLHCLQKQLVTAMLSYSSSQHCSSSVCRKWSLNVMLCMQDSGVPLASDQHALYKTLSRLLFFFVSTLLLFCLQNMVVECDAVYAGQWRASGQ